MERNEECRRLGEREERKEEGKLRIKTRQEREKEQ